MSKQKQQYLYEESKRKTTSNHQSKKGYSQQKTKKNI